MTAKIIDGKAIAKKLRAEYHARVDDLSSSHGVTPALAVILVGDNPASRSYVRNKITGCEAVGIRSELIELPVSVSEEPGGVGQMTVTMLLHNTILSAERTATATTSPFRRRA